MQSSFKIIKKNNVDAIGEEKIIFDFKQNNKNGSKISPKIDKSSIENIANAIIKEAKKKSSKILSESYEKAHLIQEEALRKGYDEGYKQGYKKGYDEAYKKAIEESKSEAEKIIENAENILMNAKNEHEEYVCKSRESIKNLILNIVKKVLRKEIENSNCFLNVIDEYLEECRESKTIIIKSNETYKKELKKQLDEWKKNSGYLGEIFILGDNLMEKGKIEIQKDNGKMYVDINECIEKIEDIIKNS